MLLLVSLAACHTETADEPAEPMTVVQLSQVDVEKLPKWEIGSVTFDTGCGSLLDFCVRTSCTVRSRDAEVSEGELVFRFDQADHAVKRERIELGPGETKTVVATFTEARLLGGASTGQCVFEPAGTRVRCRLDHTGLEPHDVVVVASLVDADGVRSAERRERVTVQPGEDREVTFLFDKQNLAGECSIEPASG